MRFGNYSVVVPEGVERESGYVGLPHGTQYRLQIMCHDHRQCDAEVSIDGKEVGTFRLAAHGRLTLERSPDDQGRFTFYSSGTTDAGMAGEASVAVHLKGLIQVRFVPEKPRYVPPFGVRTWGAGGQSQSFTSEVAEPTSGGQHTNSTRSAERTSGGITGLSGHSDQQFTNVGPIDRDESATVVITLRLVTYDAGPRPLQPAARGNPIPPPV